MSDGIVKTEFQITTKTGEVYALHSFDDRETLRDKLVETLKKQEPFVFPAKGQDGRQIEIIIPYDLIVNIQITDFSSLTIVKNRELADKRIQ